MQQNNTDTQQADVRQDSRNTAAPKEGKDQEKDRMHEAMESVGRIRRQAVTRRIHDLQASIKER